MLFKFLGALLGWIIGKSFFSALLGFFMGSLFDRLIFGRGSIRFGTMSSVNRNEYVETLLVLTSAVVKADNRFLHSEMVFVKNYFLRNFGPEYAQQALYKLREVMEQEYDIPTVCHNFSRKSNINEKLSVLQFLFGLAYSDGNISNEELRLLRNISDWLGVNRSDFESLQAMFFMSNQYQEHYSQGNYQSQSSYTKPLNNLENEYKILEIPSTATDEEVKKAYRKAAMKHHPDRVNHLGDDVRKAAEEKFSRLNQAYERIKQSRGIN